MIFVPFANSILSYVTGKTTSITGSSGKCYLGFSTTVPNADGSNFKEPASAQYPSYKRIQLNVNEAMEWTDKWGAVSGGTVTNSEEFTSAECLEKDGWPDFVYFGIFFTPSGGVPVMGDYLTDPDGEPDEDGKYPHKALSVKYNHVAIFRIGTLQLNLT